MKCPQLLIQVQMVDNWLFLSRIWAVFDFFITRKALEPDFEVSVWRLSRPRWAKNMNKLRFQPKVLKCHEMSIASHSGPHGRYLGLSEPYWGRFSIFVITRNVLETDFKVSVWSLSWPRWAKKKITLVHGGGRRPPPRSSITGRCVILLKTV